MYQVRSVLTGRESPVHTTESNYPTILLTTASNHSTILKHLQVIGVHAGIMSTDSHSVTLYPPCEIMTLHLWWAGDGGSGTHPVTQEWNGMEWNEKSACILLCLTCSPNYQQLTHRDRKCMNG